MQVPFALQCLDVIEKLHGYNIPVGRRGGGGGGEGGAGGGGDERKENIPKLF